MLRERSRRSINRSRESGFDRRSISPLAREANQRAGQEPELKLLKDQFESGLQKVKPTVLYAFRTMDPSFDDQKVGQAFLLLMSHVDSSVPITDGKLTDPSWEQI